MKKYRPRIVALGLYSYGTGFTRVLESLFKELQMKYEIHWIGIGYKGPAKEIDGYMLHPNNLEGGDVFGAYKAAEMAKSLKAEIVFILCDTWLLHNFKRTLNIEERTWKTIAYLPLDGQIIDHYPVKDIDFLDCLVAYHEGAKDHYEKALLDMRESSMINRSPKLEFAYHGVDLNTYYPLEKKEKVEARKSIFRNVENPENKIFVLNANRFFERKDLETTIKGFAIARQQTDKLMLVLHCPGTGPGRLTGLEKIATDYNVLDWCIINPLGSDYVSDTTLNRLYNSCDIGVNTSHGEGWGFICFEHGATGAAQLVPDHTASKGLWHIESRINCSGEIKLQSNPFGMYQLSAEDLGEKLIRLCKNPTELLSEKSKAQENACHPSYDWKNIAIKWEGIMMNLLESNNN